MRMLIGALLAVTALTPTLASAQGFRVGTEAQLDPGDRQDGRDDGRYARGGDEPRPRPDAARGDRGGRPEPRPFADGRSGRDDRASPGPDRPPESGGNGRGWSGDRPDRGGPEGRPSDRWADRGPRGDDRGPRRGPPRGGSPDRRADRPDRSRAGDDWRRDRLDSRDDRRGRYGFADRAAWNRGWRGDDRYDWNGYRTAHRGAYRLPRYYGPGGGYRRIGIGVGLQASLWDRRYWIDDPYAFRLPQAYGPYRWVRYYDDALLIDLNSGRVVDAVYGIFW